MCSGKSKMSVLFFAVNFILWIKAANAERYRCNFSEVLIHEDRNEFGKAEVDRSYPVRVGVGGRPWMDEGYWARVEKRRAKEASRSCKEDDENIYRILVTAFASKEIGSNNSWVTASACTWETQKYRTINYKNQPGHKIKLWQEIADCGWIEDETLNVKIRHSEIRIENTDLRPSKVTSPISQVQLTIQNTSLNIELIREKQKQEHDLKVLELEHKHAILQKELEIKSNDGARLKDSYDKLLEAVKIFHAQNVNFTLRPGELQHILNLTIKNLTIDEAKHNMALEMVEANRKYYIDLLRLNGARKGHHDVKDGNNITTLIFILICVILVALSIFLGVMIFRYKYRLKPGANGQHFLLKLKQDRYGLGHQI